MGKKVVFIHTVTGVVDLFKGLSKEFIPDARVCHIADEGLIQGVLAAGGLTPAIYRRVCEHVVAAERDGADVIQLTCSSISPCVDAVACYTGVPVLKIDEPMVETAVASHRRIGLIATAPTTLKPSTDLVRRKAQDRKLDVKIESVLCEGAYDAFLSGQMAKHDEIVKKNLTELMKRVDVVLLAQASMARIADTLTEQEKIVPILSSPRLAMARLAAALAGEAPR